MEGERGVTMMTRGSRLNPPASSVPAADQSSSEPPAAERRRWRRWVAVGALGLSLGTVGLTAAGSLLVLPEQTQAADVILVLGGDGPPRAVRAAALFRAGLAPRVLVSGDGDCRDIQDIIVAQGVPLEAVSLECESRNTYENAALSAPLLIGLHARKVLLVTSWFHLHRALACFTSAVPTVRWLPVGAPPPPGWRDGPVALLSTASLVAREYVKLVWYFLRYGLKPRA